LEADFLSMQRLCNTYLDVAVNVRPKVLTKIRELVNQTSPDIHIITVGNTEDRQQLASQWKIFVEEIERGNNIRPSASILTGCMKHLKAISEGK
jgi:hypothetical protein